MQNSCVSKRSTHFCHRVLAHAAGAVPLESWPETGHEILGTACSRPKPDYGQRQKFFVQLRKCTHFEGIAGDVIAFDMLEDSVYHSGFDARSWYSGATVHRRLPPSSHPQAPLARSFCDRGQVGFNAVVLSADNEPVRPKPVITSSASSDSPMAFQHPSGEGALRPHIHEGARHSSLMPQDLSRYTSIGTARLTLVRSITTIVL